MLQRTKLNKEQKRIIWLSSFGGMLELYDFTIYGLFSVYFAGQFFPSNNPLISIISSYAVFLTGYIARPLGGIIFSHIGDEIGRKTVMIVTMILMGIASLGLGLLPTYGTIGLWAPALMLLLRLLQGLAIGGELPSVIVYISESLPKQRGIAMGGVFAGIVGGSIPGMAINFLITHYLTFSQINSFGWRIPFLLGSLLCFVGYQIRSKLHETAVFNNLKKRVSFPLGTLLKHHLGKVFIGVGLVSIMATSALLAIVFMPTYLTKILKFDPAQVSNAVLLTTLFCITSIYITGLLADRLSPYLLMKKAILLLILAAGACYLMIAKEYHLTLALILFGLFQGASACLAPLLLSTLFPPEIRLSGVALSYNIAFVLFGGLTPIAVTALIGWTHMPCMVPFSYVFLVALIALISLARCRKYLDTLHAE